MLAVIITSKSMSPLAGTTKARSLCPSAMCSPSTLKEACSPRTGSARSLGFWMFSLTRKVCCSRLPFVSSIPATDTVGRSNLGVSNEHAARRSDQPMNSNRVRGNIDGNDTDNIHRQKERARTSHGDARGRGQSAGGRGHVWRRGGGRGRRRGYAERKPRAGQGDGLSRVRGRLFSCASRGSDRRTYRLAQQRYPLRGRISGQTARRAPEFSAHGGRCP